MAVRIRLTRVGSKKNPIYRVVVADSRSPRDGRYIEIVGRYNPQTDPSTIDLDEAKIKDWLPQGRHPAPARPRAPGPPGVPCSRLPTDPADLVRVGRVGRPHGVDGAFVVEDGSDDPRRF